MKKFFTLLAAAAAMTLTAGAQELVIPTNVDNPNVTIINQGNFDAASYGIGSTNETTRISLGMVDFGETGENFKAVGIRFANGWSNGGAAILTAGEGDAAVQFASIALIGTSGYGQFKTIAANMTAVPTGEQEVFLTFENRAGNIRAAYFYADELSADDFSEGSILKTPAQMDGYAEVSGTLNVLESQLVEGGSGETRIDNDSWGWTQGGVVVNYGSFDFGNGDYNQLVAYFKHGGWGLINFFEIYIDEIAPANRIAQVYAGLEINSLTPQARNLEQTVTGVHNVLVKWYGGSINVGNLEFVKGNLWLEEPFYAAVPAVPSENAARYSFRNQFNVNPEEGVVYIGRDSGLTDIVNQGQWENDNVGWTGNGTVLKVKDVDFADGNFNKIIVEYGSEPANANNFENTIKFYVDSQDGDPVATVQIVGTSSWNTIFQAGGDLTAVEGVHDLYMVYSVGVNVKDIYLDGPAPAVKSAINFNAEMENATVEVQVAGEAIESGAEVAEGTEVTVVVTPADGYKVAGVTVETAAPSAAAGAPRRAAVDVEEAGNNTYTFVMPAEAVTVNVEVVETVVTAVTDINVANSAAVKYVNAQGQVSDRPFQGINIVIEGNKAYKIVK